MAAQQLPLAADDRPFAADRALSHGRKESEQLINPHPQLFRFLSIELRELYREDSVFKRDR